MQSAFFIKQQILMFFIFSFFYICHRQRHKFTLMAVVHNLFSFCSFFNPCLFPLPSSSLCHHSGRHSLFSHGSGRNTQRVETYFHVQVASFMSNMELEAKSKGQCTWPSQTGTKSDELSDPVSSEDSGHCLHQGNTAEHKGLKGQVKYNPTSPPLALGHTLKFQRKLEATCMYKQ